MKLKQALKTATAMVMLLWGIHAFNWFLPFDLRHFGIRPRSLEGLVGILGAPLLHGNLSHLAANTGALIVLLTVALAYHRKLAISALGIIILGGGLAVWLFGSASAIHIGASGVVFGLVGYLLFIGLFRREWVALAVSAAVLLLYGGGLFSLLQITPGVSWSSHFYGFLAGVLAAWRSKQKR
jgi:membrane associated rhomboid family serine protease